MPLHRSLPLLFAALQCLSPAAEAAQEQAVMIFNLPPGMYTRTDNPPCQRSLNISKLLSSPALTAALSGGDPSKMVLLQTVGQVLQEVQKHGGDIAGLINEFNGGDWSRCESGCVVVPKGARITEIRISGRKGDERVSYLASGPNPHDPRSPEILKHGGVLNAGSMGDWSGYQGLQVQPTGRAVCTTAKNWSHNEPTSQVVRVIYDR